MFSENGFFHLSGGIRCLFTTSIWQVIERVHVLVDSWFSWRHESPLRLGIRGLRFFRVAATMISKWKYEVKIARILFKFIICLSFERVEKHRMVKSKIFGKLSLNFSFCQGSYLKSDFAWPNSVKVVLRQISIRFEIVIFNNSFTFCLAGFLKPLMISFCSMPWVANSFPLREIIERTSVFCPVCLKKYFRKVDHQLWWVYFEKVAWLLTTDYLKWIRHFAWNLRNVLTEVWKDKKPKKIWTKKKKNVGLVMWSPEG